VIARHAQLRPSAVALVHPGGALTYRELHEQVSRICPGLRELGLSQDRPLAILSENRVEYALLLLSCAAAGVPVAAVNWRLPPDKISRAIQLVGPAAVAVSGSFASADEALAGSADVAGFAGAGQRKLICFDAEAAPGAIPWARVAGGMAHTAEPPMVTGDDIATIMYTSGSSGDPKAVAISHAALMSRALLISAELSVESTDAFLGWAPMFHVSSTDYLFVTCFLGGVYVLMNGFDASLIAQQLSERDVGWLMLMPGLISELLTALDGRDLRRVRCVGAMADLVPPDQLAALTGRLRAPYVNSFGSTEAGLVPGASLLAPGAAAFAAADASALDKIPTNYCQLRLVDEKGTEVALGEVGELVLRGPTLFSRYWGDSDATAEAFRGGWFHTGDLMRMKPGGALAFVDRVKYVVKSGGENVYPAVIEKVLMSHPQVTEAVAVRHPHPRLGEAVRAFVVVKTPAPSPADLMDFAGRHLARYEIPRWLEIVDAAELPRNVTGKFVRADLERRPLTVAEVRR
jgi:fatty-acyl-CoA synthase